MKKLFSLLVLALVAGTASAQFTATVEQQIRTDYACQNAEFSLTAVAQAVGTDTATLAAALDTWYVHTGEEEPVYTNPDTQLFGILNADGTFCDGYNCDGRGSYWLNMDGTLGAWGDNAVYNSLLEWDATADLFAIPVGHHPTAITDSVATLHFVLNYGGKQATFNVAYTILPLPKAPAPASILASEQNIVGSESVVVERTTVQGFDATQITFDAQKAADALGLTPEMLGNFLPSFLYMQQCDPMQELTDSLSNNYTAGAPGFWMKRTLYPVGHDKAGEVSPYLGARSFADDDDVFVEGFAYDAENNTITARVGQHPGCLQADDDLFANLYLVNGDKTYQLTVEVKVSEPETQGLDGMVEKELITYNLQQPPTTDYSTVNFNVDVDAIATTLGCDKASVQVMALASEDTFWAGAGSANNGGFWFNKAGYVCSWDGDGSTANFFIEPSSDQDFSSLNIGQHAGATHLVGDSCVADLFYVNASNYVRVHVALEIVEKQEESTDEWQMVGQRVLTVQQVANEGYEWSEQTAILKADDLIALIGTASPTLYGEVADTLGNISMTKDYTCDPKPGFWLTADGYVSNWGNNTTWGITTEGGTTKAGTDYGFKCMQFPGSGVVGNSWSGNFYLLNPETNQYLKVVLTSRVVEVVQETEVVGEMNLLVPITIEGTEVEVPWDSIATALGTTVDDLTNNGTLHGASGLGASLTTGLSFTANGTVAATDTDGAFSIVYEGDHSIFAFSSLEEEVADDWKVPVEVYVEYEGKQFILHTIFCSQAIYTPVERIQAHNAATRLYDLQGRTVSRATKGVYIQDGRKVIVK